MVCVVTDGRRIVATVACEQAFLINIAISRFETINTGKLARAVKVLTTKL